MDEETLKKSNTSQRLPGQAPGPSVLRPQDIRHPQVLKIPTKPMQILQRTTIVHGTGRPGQTSRPKISLLKDGVKILPRETSLPKIQKFEVVTSPSSIQTNVPGIGPNIVQTPIQPVQTNQKLSSFRLIRTQTGELKLLNPDMVAQPLKVTSVVPSFKVHTMYPPSMKPDETKSSTAPKAQNEASSQADKNKGSNSSPKKTIGLNVKATNPVLRHLLTPKFDTQCMKTHSKLKSKELTRIRKQKMKNLRKHIERKIQKKIDYKAIRAKRKAREAARAAAAEEAAAASTSPKDTASTSDDISIVDQHLNRSSEPQEKEKVEAKKAETKEVDEKNNELVVIIKDHNEKEVNLESHLSFAGTSVKPKFAIEFSPNNLQAYVQAVANAVDYHKNNPQPNKVEPKPKKKKKHKHREEEVEEEVIEPPPVIPSVPKSSRRKQTLCAREDPADSGVVIMQGPKGYDKLRKKKVPPKAKVVIPLAEIIKEKPQNKKKARKEVTTLSVVQVKEEADVDVVGTSTPVPTGPAREVGIFIPPALAEPASPDLHPKLIIGKRLPNEPSETVQSKSKQSCVQTAKKTVTETESLKSNTKPKEAPDSKANQSQLQTPNQSNSETPSEVSTQRTVESKEKAHIKTKTPEKSSKSPAQAKTSGSCQVSQIETSRSSLRTLLQLTQCQEKPADQTSKIPSHSNAAGSAKELFPVAIEEIKMESEDISSEDLQSPLDVIQDQSITPIPEKVSDCPPIEQPKENNQSSDNIQPGFDGITKLRSTEDNLSNETSQASVQSNEDSQMCEDFKLFENVQGEEEVQPSSLTQESDDSQISEDSKYVDIIKVEEEQHLDDLHLGENTKTSRNSSSPSVSLAITSTNMPGRRVRKPSYKVSENIQVAMLKALKKQRKEIKLISKPSKNTPFKGSASINKVKGNAKNSDGNVNGSGAEPHEKVPLVQMTTSKAVLVNVPESPCTAENPAMVSLLKPYVLNQLKSQSNTDELVSIKEEKFENSGGSTDLESLTAIANMKSPIDLPIKSKSGRRKQTFNEKQDSTVHHSPAKESTALQNVKDQHEYIKQLSTIQQYCQQENPVTVINGPTPSVIKVPVINAMRNNPGDQKSGVLVGPFSQQNQQNKQVYVVPDNVYTALLSAQASTGKQIKLSSNDLMSGASVLPLSQPSAGQGTIIQGAIPNQPQMNIVGTTNIPGIVSNFAGPLTNIIGTQNIVGTQNIAGMTNIVGALNIVGAQNIVGTQNIVSAPNLVGTTNLVATSNVVGAQNIAGMTNIIVSPSIPGATTSVASPTVGIVGNLVVPQSSLPPKKVIYGRTPSPPVPSDTSANLNIKIDSVVSLNMVSCKLMDKVPSHLDKCLSSELKHSMKLCFVVLDRELPPLVDGRTKPKRTRLTMPKVCQTKCRAKCLKAMCQNNVFVNINRTKEENFEPEEKKMRLDN